MGFPFLSVGVQDLVGIAPWTIIAQICNLLLQMYLFKRFLFEPVKKIVQKRQQEVDKIYEDASQADEQAKSAKAEYEQKLTQARDEAALIVQNATQDAQQRSEDILREAKKNAEAVRRKASADIALERKKALNEAKDDISEIALNIAEKVVEKQLTPQDQQALIADFIEKMGDQQ